MIWSAQVCCWIIVVRLYGGSVFLMDFKIYSGWVILVVSDFLGFLRNLVLNEKFGLGGPTKFNIHRGLSINSKKVSFPINFSSTYHNQFTQITTKYHINNQFIIKISYLFIGIIIRNMHFAVIFIACIDKRKNEIRFRPLSIYKIHLYQCLFFMRLLIERWLWNVFVLCFEKKERKLVSFIFNRLNLTISLL